MLDEKKLALLEAILFTTTGPMNIEKLMKLTRTTSRERMEQMIAALKERYSRPDTGIMLSELGGYRLTVKPDFVASVSGLTPHADLSRGVLRVLAIIAYHEPIKQADIVKVIGNRTYEYVKDLEGRGLVKVEKKSRTKILSTTPLFEEYFGQKKSLLKEKLREPQEKKEEEDETL